MTWLRASLFAQVLLALYFQAIQWLPLGDWNTQCPSGDEIACGLGNQGLSVPGYQPLSVLAFEGRLSAHDALYCVGATAPLWVFWFAYSRALRWLMWAQAGFYSVWMALQMGWWVLYAYGRTDSQVELYQRVLGHSTQLLPSFGRHLPPDGLHLVLQILLGAVLVSTLTGLLKTPDTTRIRQ
jgi:hypothetical protein